MPEKQTPLDRLVIVITCIAIAATVIAGIHWYAIDLPQQKTFPPQNTAKTVCLDQCTSDFSTCISGCRDDMCRYRCENTYGSCNNDCNDRYEQPCADCKTTCDSDYTACLAKPGYTEGDCAGIRNSCLDECPC